MNRILLLLLVVLSTQQLTAQRRSLSVFISPDNPNILYTGRIDFTDQMRPVFMYSGVTMQTNVKGTDIDLLIKGNAKENYFNIIIDGNVKVLKINDKDTVYAIARNLLNKPHSVTIFRRTEWHAGDNTFLGFRVNKRAKLSKPDEKERKIEFIGNSITCGYGNEGASNKEKFAYSTENNYLAYGAITARELDTDYVAVCRSGIGLYLANTDTNFVMPKLFHEVTNKNSSPWNFKNYQADVIVIELGCNDFAGKPDSSKFVKRYLEFLKTVRSHNTTAKIVCVAGPFDDGNNDQKLHFENFVQSVVRVQNQTDPNTFFYSMGPMYPTGSDWHPSVKQHYDLANKLVPFIKKITGWK